MFIINGTTINAGITSIGRNFKKIYKYDVTTEDGTRHQEVKAIYPVYTLTIGYLNQSDYDELYELISGYETSYSVTLPYSQTDITFNANIEMGGDTLVFVENDGTKRWDGLTLTITGVEPIEEG